MAMIDEKYNLPGFGLITTKLYPYAEKIYSYLNWYGHIDHLKIINQFGELREVHPGVHHTRLECLIVQLSIIYELCKLSGHCIFRTKPACQVEFTFPQKMEFQNHHFT